MSLDREACYRALRARDARFDGRFFVGVASTRIYCRPICTVRPPAYKNCSFYPSAAAAELEGFRPCLRCRPELAPGNASVDATRRLAHAAARLIEDGSLNERGVEGVAGRLGVTDRHLRRVFREQFGVAPVSFAQTQRLLLAKRLLTDTDLSVTEIAFASGWNSLRRFNASFQSRYRFSPSRLRKATARAEPLDALSFELSYRPPYDWANVLAFLAARSISGVEDATRTRYRRSVRVVVGSETSYGWIEVALAARAKPALQVRVSASLAKAVPAVLARTKDLLDLSCSPADVAQALGPLAQAHPGLRVPGAFDGFEIAVRAVLGQQISVAAARTIAGRFAAAFGSPIETPFAAVSSVFPTPEQVLRVPYERIAELGVIGTRARSILALAQAVASGELRLAPDAEVEPTLAKLRALPGVGEWTAQYIAMRALAWPDAFLHTDLGVLKALGDDSPKRALAAAESYRPWRAYAVMHLWQRLHDRSIAARLRARCAPELPGLNADVLQHKRT